MISIFVRGPGGAARLPRSTTLPAREEQCQAPAAAAADRPSAAAVRALLPTRAEPARKGRSHAGAGWLLPSSRAPFHWPAGFAQGWPGEAPRDPPALELLERAPDRLS